MSDEQDQRDSATDRIQNMEDAVGRLEFRPRGDESVGTFGFPVVTFDGTNFETIVSALDLEVGDVVIAMPGKPMVMKRSEFERMLRMEQ